MLLIRGILRGQGTCRVNFEPMVNSLGGIYFG